MIFTEFGSEKEELRIILRNCSHVGYDGFISACEGTIVCLDVKEGQYFRNGNGAILIEVTSGRDGPTSAPIASVVLRANGLLEREKCVQNVINGANS